MAGCNKSYSDNFISSRSSTRLHAPPGGGSSIGNLLFGGPPAHRQQPQQQQQQPQHVGIGHLPGHGSNPHQQRGRMGKENQNRNQNYGRQSQQQQQQQYQAQQGGCHVSHEKPASMREESKSQEAMTDAEKVREFTFEAGQPVPETPQAMNVREVNFVVKMILDELLELYSTVLPPQRAKSVMMKMIDEAKEVRKMNCGPNDQHELIAEQGDAFVDIWYYSLNCMAKKGVNLSAIFDLVHNANMAKRDPQTGKFNKREDGKIIKPRGWRAPNVGMEIKRQLQQGAWQ